MLTKDQRTLLAKLSREEDMVSARELCREFIRSTEEMAASMGVPKDAGQMLCSLLSGTVYPSTQADMLFAQLFGNRYGNYMLTVLASEAAGTCYDAIAAEMNQIPGCWCVTYQNRLICLSGCGRSGSPLEYRQSVQAILRDMVRKYGLSGGISRPFSDLAALRDFYTQALETLKTIFILQRGPHLASYDDFLMIRLFDGLREDVTVEDFALPDIQILQAYDAKHNTELCRTMLCYLVCSKNISSTARALNIHRNTVHYRVNKCIDMLSDLDFSDDYITFLLMLSLHIAEYDDYKRRKEAGESWRGL